MRYYSSIAGATTLAASCSDTATTIELSATSGLPSQFPFTLVLDAGTISEEIVSVTGLSGASAVVVRGEDGSPAQAHQMGAGVRHMASARDFREPQQHMAATVTHGASSNLVGVSDTQTLSNKTLDASTQVVVDGAPVPLADAIATSQGSTFRWVGTLPAGSRTSYDTLVVPALPGGGPFDLQVTAEIPAAPAGVYLFLDGTFEAPGDPTAAPGKHQFPVTQTAGASYPMPMSFRTYWPYTGAVTFRVQTPSSYNWSPMALSIIATQTPA